jgi:uncharacterized Zn finger protein
MNIPKDGKWHRVADYQTPEEMAEFAKKIKANKPKYELYCLSCGTTSYVYEDTELVFTENEPYFKCHNCGEFLSVKKTSVKKLLI